MLHALTCVKNKAQWQGITNFGETLAYISSMVAIAMGRPNSTPIYRWSGPDMISTL